MRRCGMSSGMCGWRCSASPPADAEDTYMPRALDQVWSTYPMCGSCCRMQGWRHSRTSSRGGNNLACQEGNLRTNKMVPLVHQSIPKVWSLPITRRKKTMMPHCLPKVKAALSLSWRLSSRHSNINYCLQIMKRQCNCNVHSKLRSQIHSIVPFLWPLCV